MHQPHLNDQRPPDRPGPGPWEESPDRGGESKTLDAFIHHLEDWPGCHIFLALRLDEPAYGTVQKLVASRSGQIDLYPLEPRQISSIRLEIITKYGLR